MSVDETPGTEISHFGFIGLNALNIKFLFNFSLDFDRAGSSPPKQNSQLTTTPYTPGSGQKRFNPFMKDTPTSQSSIDEHTQQQQHQHQNDENKNIIMLDDDDDNNRNILSTQNNSNSQKLSQLPHTTSYIDDDDDDDDGSSPAKQHIIHSDSDSNELTGSVHNETPLPDWIALNESVLIRPYNHSGVISFIGPTHFSVNFYF